MTIVPSRPGSPMGGLQSRPSWPRSEADNRRSPTGVAARGTGPAPQGQPSKDGADLRSQRPRISPPRGHVDRGSSIRSERLPPTSFGLEKGVPIHRVDPGSTRLLRAVRAANAARPWCPAPRPLLRRSWPTLEALVQEAPACEDLTVRAPTAWRGVGAGGH